MANYDLIAFDLDGTIFASPVKPVMSPRVTEALQAAHDAGVVLAVASGRPTGMLGSHVSGLPFVDWHITVNGAMVSDARTHEIISKRPIPKSTALMVARCVNEACSDVFVGWNMFAYGVAHFERALVERQRFKFAEGEESFSFADSALADGSDIRIIDSVIDTIEILPDGVDKLGARFDTKADADRAEHALRAYGGQPLEIARVKPTELEITLAGVGKGSALSILCRHLGIDERRAVAFGDSGNDATFAQSPCTFVAMGNASPEIKAVADDITDSVTHDGVATWLNAHLGTKMIAPRDDTPGDGGDFVIR